MAAFKAALIVVSVVLPAIYPAAVVADDSISTLETSGADLVRTLPGAVVPTTGVSTTRVPIVLPAGSAGLTPEVALVYAGGSPKGGAGPVGFGWSIAGLSSISRDRKFGPPYDYADKTCGVGGDQYCYREAFVLDGQDLICEVDPCNDIYKTQRDDGRRIEFVQPHWVIYDRQGRTITYGAAPNDATRVINPRNWGGI